VVEAVVEDLAVKQALFEALDEICKPGAILATTTSSPARGRVAAATKRPAGRRGPALLQPGSGDEAGRGRSTVATGRRRRRHGGRGVPQARQAPGHCGDRAGFIVNALLFPYLNDAVKMLEATTRRPTTSTPR
jgi:3-hydroxybutyryl-CoA dehydrogenase